MRIYLSLRYFTSFHHLVRDGTTHRTVSSILGLSENCILNGRPPAHLSMLLSRGRRTRIPVASKSRLIGATIHNDYSLVSQQREGNWSAEHVLLNRINISISHQSTM